MKFGVGVVIKISDGENGKNLRKPIHWISSSLRCGSRPSTAQINNGRIYSTVKWGEYYGLH